MIFLNIKEIIKAKFIETSREYKQILLTFDIIRVGFSVLSNHLCVVASTMRTFMSNYVKRNIFSLESTFITQNVCFFSFYCFLQLFIHISFSFLDVLFNVLFMLLTLIKQAGAASRTIRISCFQNIIVVAFLMDAMTTFFKLNPQTC